MSARDVLARFAAGLAIAVLLGHVASADEPSRRPLHLQDVPWQIGPPSEKPTRVESASGNGRDVQIRVRRIWHDKNRSRATVAVRNTGTIEFHDMRLRCTAFDSRGKEVAAAERMLTPAAYGAMKPGFTTQLDLDLDTPLDVRALTCVADVRGMPKRLPE